MIGVSIDELMILFVLLLFFLPFILAFIDILRSDFGGNNKIVWLLAVIFVPFLGPIAYFVVGRKQRIAK